MRKLHLSLGLALLLLLAQQGAVLHEVSHMSRLAAASAEVTVDVDRGLAKTCELCLAFSQVTNPAGNTVSVAWLEPCSSAAGARPPCSIIPCDVLAPRSRGPPLPRSNV